METVDIKTIVYFVIAILWFLYSSFTKAQKENRKKAAQPPPLKEEEVKEIFQREIRRPKPKPLVSPVVESPSVFQTSSKLEKKVAKNPTTTSTSFLENETPGFEADPQSVITAIDPKYLVLYSEIMKRPNY
jgi:uncharacterized protein YneF (UPF0154 family)